LVFGKRIVGAFRAFAAKLLDLDDTEVPREQLALLSDFLAKYRFDTNVSGLKELVAVLKKKHMVDEIIIAQNNGGLLASTEGDGITAAVSSTALFYYVQSEIPESQYVLIKSGNDWNMIFHYGKKIFVIKAPASLSTLELRAIAREVEDFLAKKTQKKTSKPRVIEAESALEGIPAGENAFLGK
jgi:hypothetical protein